MKFKHQAQCFDAFAGIACGLGVANVAAHVGRHADASAQIGEQAGIHLGPAGMRDGFALRDLGQLAHHAADHDARQTALHGGIQRVF